MTYFDDDDEKRFEQRWVGRWVKNCGGRLERLKQATDVPRKCEVVAEEDLYTVSESRLTCYYSTMAHQVRDCSVEEYQETVFLSRPLKTVNTYRTEHQSRVSVVQLCSYLRNRARR